MIRLGPHYVEPRRIGFFILEETAIWIAFLLGAGVVSHLLGRTPQLPGLLLRAVAATATIEAGLYLCNLHDLPTALADAVDGRRLWKVLGGATVALGAAFSIGLGGTHVDAPSMAGLGSACLAALGLRAALPRLTDMLGLRTRIFLVGDGALARVLVREIARDGNVEVAGFAGPQVDDLAGRAAAAGCETIVVAADNRTALPASELLACRAEGLHVIEGAAFAARALHRLPIDLVRPRDLIFADGFARPLWLRFARRAVSVAVAGLLLVAAAPLLAVCALAIRLGDRGPILFRQERVGRRGRRFHIYKLRTMSVDAEAAGAAWAQKDDPRVTRVGRILRRYRIDELPQLWNVLVGEMDLVGPRPERPEFVADLARKIPFYDLRHLVRPGITGWAQVRYPYAASVEEAREKLQYDLYFVRHLSLSLDLFILLLTAKVVIGGRGSR
jgi:exopolysaccharide biosynthesis polyprenyl glycosylphosphotransferase